MIVDKLEAFTPDRVDGLSPQLRRAARFVVDNPGEIATRSLRHVAQAADLPPPTFTRLARAIGYESYGELRELCRAALLRRRGNETHTEEAKPATGSLYEQNAALAIGGIETLLSQIDTTQMQEVARTLANARRVVLVAEMRARAFVDYATYLSDMAYDGWDVIGRGTLSLAAETRDLGPQDAALVLTTSPYARRSVETVQLVAETGASIVALTDSPLSPVAKYAKHLLVISFQSAHSIPSYVVASLVIETLFGMVVEEKGADAQQRIADTARRGRDLNEYWRE